MSYKNTPLIFLIIFLEGFAVLASEILMIRRFIPYVGNSIDTTATIIGLVLLPLSLGYYYGGNKISFRRSLRNKLKFNMAISILFLGLGFSLYVNEFIFNLFKDLGFGKVLQIMLYMGIFFIYPVFLLAQTVPLISNYFGQRKLSSIAGKILAFSTIGSLAGSFVTSLVIINYFGVTVAVYAVLIVLIAILSIISRRREIYNLIVPLCFVCVVIFFDNYYKQVRGVISDNLYSTITIQETDGGSSRILNINNSNSAKYAEIKVNRFTYVSYVEDSILDNMNILNDPKEILIIGSGGFTIGIDDDHNFYDYVDIDKTLQEISENYLLKQKLGPNKRAFTAPARLFINNLNKKYDVIIVDAFSNTDTIPFQLLSLEFFKSLKEFTKQGGIITFNIATRADFSDKFSIHVDNTLRTAFPNITRQIVTPYIFGEDQICNVVYIYNNHDYSSKTIYTDDHNTSDSDSGKRIN